MADPEFFSNPLLFGADSTERLVAVEFDGERTVTLYARDGDGRVTATHDAFGPFLWTAAAMEDSAELAGNLPLRFLTKFPDWKAFQDRRSALRGADFPWFAITDPVQQYLTATGRTLFKGMEFGDLVRLQIRIKTGISDGYVFPHADRDALTAIALSDSTGWEEFIAIEGPSGEKAALERLGVILSERDPDVVEGHDLFKFAFPFLAARAKKSKVRLRWGRDASPLSGRPSRIQIAEKTIQYTRFTIHGRHVVDTFLLAQLYDVGTRELDSFGLSSVAAHFGVRESGREVVSDDEFDAEPATDPEAIRGEALQDVRETRAISEILSPSYFTQTQIFPYNLQDVIVRGNATRINALFLRAYLAAGHALPVMPEATRFEGGYTDVFVTGVVRDVWHCDVASLYPSVMLRFKMLPSSDQLGIFASMLGDLRTYRLAAKTKMRAAQDPGERRGFDALQSVFKILINSFYGYLGFAQGHFADFDAASAVTAKGRELLREMVAWLGERGATVIEIDTDGIYFQPPRGATPGELQDGMRRILPDGIDVEFDESFRAMFSYKAKNYALLAEDGRITMKGAALKSRGMEPYLRGFLRQFVELILSDQALEVPPLYARLVEDLRSRRISVRQLAKSEALQDSPSAYQRKISASSRNRAAAFEVALASGRDYQAGDVVSYYITGTKKKVTAYDHAKPLSAWNPDAPDENVEYYVGKLEELYKKFSVFLVPDEGAQQGFDF